MNVKYPMKHNEEISHVTLKYPASPKSTVIINKWFFNMCQQQNVFISSYTKSPIVRSVLQKRKFNGFETLS